MALVPACLLALAVADRPAFPQAKDPGKKDAAKKARSVKKVRVGRHVFVEVEDRKPARVLVEAYVCNRNAPLEHLLSRRRCKEHEAILAADIDARDLHTALLAAGGVAGSPVKYKDDTYYVCCSGCKDAFNENPEKYIAEFKAKKRSPLTKS